MRTGSYRDRKINEDGRMGTGMDGDDDDDEDNNVHCYTVHCNTRAVL